MRTTNHLFLRGYVGQAPRSFGKTCKVSVATNRNWKDKEGQRREETDWVTVTILNEKTAKFVAENVKKGDPIYAECRIAEGRYDKDGETVYTTDVIANVFDLLTQRGENSDGGVDE
jgi:single-strand DNA-binding protein